MAASDVRTAPKQPPNRGPAAVPAVQRGLADPLSIDNRDLSDPGTHQRRPQKQVHGKREPSVIPVECLKDRGTVGPLSGVHVTKTRARAKGGESTEDPVSPPVAGRHRLGPAPPEAISADHIPALADQPHKGGKGRCRVGVVRIHGDDDRLPRGHQRSVQSRAESAATTVAPAWRATSGV